MDEPTAALSGVEVERLFAVARSLRDEGRALVFISHRFDEVFALCDTVTVMRDGEYVSHRRGRRDLRRRDRSPGWSAARSATCSPRPTAEVGDVVLEVDGLTSAGTFHDVSFTVRAGEIVGLAGLVGAGRSEIARAVFGVDRYDAGTVRLAGRDVRRHDPRAAVRAGIAFVPEDRRKQGLVTESSVARNVAGVIRGRLTHAGLLTNRDENRAAAPWAGRLEVKTSALDMHATTMSGGNQQKVVLAKWLATEPKLLIIDEPTRGIDVGTKAEVHRLLSELAGQGMAILMISSELPEVLGMSDRVLVVCEGRITAELDRDEATPETVMHAATASVTHTAEVAERLHHDHEEVDAHERHPPRRAEPDLAHPPRPGRRCSAPARSRSPPCWSRSSSLTTLKSGSFLFSDNGWRNLLLTPSILLLLAVGQTVVIITRNVDLSVGSILGLTAYLTGTPVRRQPRHPDRRGLPRRAWRSAPCSAWSTASWWPSARCRRW